MEIDSEIFYKAIAALQPIKYEPFDTGYYVTRNGQDQGGCDYCINCISNAVKSARRYHKAARQNIINNFEHIAKQGFYYSDGKPIQIKGKYTDKEIAASRRLKLKDFPARVKFSYEGHDPDFGGGLTEPTTCENCGETFSCSFVANKEEAQHILHLSNLETISEQSKWEMEVAFINGQYCKSEAKEILAIAAKNIIKSESKETLAIAAKALLKN